MVEAGSITWPILFYVPFSPFSNLWSPDWEMVFMFLSLNYAPSRGGAYWWRHWPMGCGQKGQGATTEQKLWEALQVSTHTPVLLCLARRTHSSSPCSFSLGPNMRRRPEPNTQSEAKSSQAQQNQTVLQTHEWDINACCEAVRFWRCLLLQPKLIDLPKAGSHISTP